jgi:hypothetical protein
VLRCVVSFIEKRLFTLTLSVNTKEEGIVKELDVCMTEKMKAKKIYI